MTRKWAFEETEDYKNKIKDLDNIGDPELREYLQKIHNTEYYGQKLLVHVGDDAQKIIQLSSEGATINNNMLKELRKFGYHPLSIQGWKNANKEGFVVYFSRD